jgi:hypothetical protein
VPSSCSNHNKSIHNKHYTINVKGCGQEIYFDANHSKSQRSKYIPLDKDRGQPHHLKSCMGNGTFELSHGTARTESTSTMEKRQSARALQDNVAVTVLVLI